MRMISESLAAEELEFARAAAAKFAANPETISFSIAGPKPGALLALRWGLMDRSVVVVRISDDEPTLFTDIIQSSNGQ